MKKIMIGLTVLLAAIVGVSAEEIEAGGLTPPQVKVRTQLTPFYPATETLFGTTATVVLRADVGADGRIADLSVVDCDRPQLGFEQSALDAVRHWRFKPANRDGQPVGATTLVTLRLAPPSGGGFGPATTQAQFGAAFDIGTPFGLQPKNPEQPRPNGGPHMDRIRKADRPPCGREDRGCSYDRSEMNRTRRLVALPRPTGDR